MTEISFAERIAQILMKLYRGEAITCSALVSEFGVHERTIYRDIGRLSGIVERIAGGGGPTSSPKPTASNCKKMTCRVLPA